MVWLWWERPQFKGGTNSLDETLWSAKTESTKNCQTQPMERTPQYNWREKQRLREKRLENRLKRNPWENMLKKAHGRTPTRNSFVFLLNVARWHCQTWQGASSDTSSMHYGRELRSQKAKNYAIPCKMRFPRTIWRLRLREQISYEHTAETKTSSNTHVWTARNKRFKRLFKIDPYRGPRRSARNKGKSDKGTIWTTVITKTLVLRFFWYEGVEK